MCFASARLIFTWLSLVLGGAIGLAQTTPAGSPNEIRGYKVERARVEILSRNSGRGAGPVSQSGERNELVRFGAPHIASITPLGLTFELPVTIAAVKAEGHVDFLAFENVTVNGSPVTVDEYRHPFDLPNEREFTLRYPLRVYISTPRAVIGAVGELWGPATDTWPVTGTVMVFGRFKKHLFKFKRVVPVELNVAIPNPLKNSTN